MQQMLASDIGNPEFVGARNPDDMLYVEFYWDEPVDKNKSEEAGKVVRMTRTPFVRIMRPGDNTSIIETPVRDDHKQRWPQKWIAWQMKEGLIDGAADVPGWRIEEWDVLTDGERHELKYLRFYTVELIAGASDAQCQKLGMGGLAMREKARLALREKMNAGIKAELDAKDGVIAAQGKMLEELAARMTAMESSKSAGNTLGLPQKKG